MSPLYYNIPFDSQYTLDTALKDDIDELWHKDIEQLEQILDAELKEAERVNHELHSRKRKIISDELRHPYSFVTVFFMKSGCWLW